VLWPAPRASRARPGSQVQARSASRAWVPVAPTSTSRSRRRPCSAIRPVLPRHRQHPAGATRVIDVVIATDAQGALGTGSTPTRPTPMVRPGDATRAFQAGRLEHLHHRAGGQAVLRRRLRSPQQSSPTPPHPERPRRDDVDRLRRHPWRVQHPPQRRALGTNPLEFQNAFLSLWESHLRGPRGPVDGRQGLSAAQRPYQTNPSGSSFGSPSRPTRSTRR